MSSGDDSHNRVAEIASRFLDVYSVCSQLITEIGKDAVRSWSEVEVEGKKKQFVEQMICSGFTRTQSQLAWQLIVQGRANPGGSYEMRSGLESQSLSSTVASDENVFSFEGGRWVVRFQGKTVYPSGVTGIKYLHRLISRSGEMIPAKELYEDFGSRKRRKRSSSVSQLDALDSGITAGVAKSDVVIDSRGKREMLDRLDAIETEMATAKRVPDADQIERLAMEKIGIKEQLRKAFTPVGSRRIQEPDRVRRMKAVDIAIRRAKEKIEAAGHRSLVIHLNETIEVKLKSGCIYLPDESVKWRTEPVSFTPPRRPR